METSKAEKAEEIKSLLSVDDALKMYEEYKSYWSDNYREAVIDLKMAAGEAAAHYGQGWDEKYTAPVSSMVVDNELPQYIHQVTNDIRQNEPSIKVLPISDGDIETGEIFSGLFRAIEDHSHADEVIDTAAEYSVTCGIGFMAVDHDYCFDGSDEQEIIFKTIPDPLSEFIDPASVEYDGRDSNGHISLVPISKKDFDRQHKGKKFVSFTEPKADTSKLESIILGQVFIREHSGERGKNITVRRYLFSGEELLLETTFPGKYIPRVPIYGQVKWIEGKRILESLIRQARSPQRRLNHMLSKESQLLAQAPIAPIMAVEGTLVNERRQWQIPGLENALEYRQTDLEGNSAPAPTRLQPPGASAGFLEAIASAKEAIKASMGIYSAGLGKREGDVSGIALQRLDNSGDVATFHYPDNVRRSYAHMGEIAIDMIPVIYDTPRVVQTLNEESDVVMVGVNGAKLQDGQKRSYDLTKGKYRVRITTGASYTTKRQQEAAFFQEAFKANPALWEIGGDLAFKSMDSPGAQAMATRMKKALPPQFQDDSDQPQIPPQLVQKMQQMEQIIQQGAQEIQSLQQQLESKQTEDALKAQELQIKGQEVAVKGQEVAVKSMEAKAKLLQAMGGGSVSPDQVPEAQPVEGDDETIGMLHAKLSEKMAAKEQEDAEAMQMQQMMQMQAEQDARDEAEERALKLADMQAREQQTTAILGTLNTIAQQLSSLNTNVAKPKQIIRDPQTGMITDVL